MKSGIAKRSVVIAGHKTSVSLEEAFWSGLKAIAADSRITVADLISRIAAKQRQHNPNLSSALRLFVLDHYQNRQR